MTTPWMKDVRLPCNSVGDPAPAVKWTKDRCARDPREMGDPREGCSRRARKKGTGCPSLPADQRPCRAHGSCSPMQAWPPCLPSVGCQGSPFPGCLKRPGGPKKHWVEPQESRGPPASLLLLPAMFAYSPGRAPRGRGCLPYPSLPPPPLQ